MAEPGNATRIAVLFALAAPFYLNDFASIAVTDWRAWLAIDYVAVKLLPLAVITWVVASGRMAPADFGLVPQRAPVFLAVFAAAALAGTLIDQNAYRLLAPLPGYAALGAMPKIESAAWNAIDLTLGLLLVGAVEELVFRAYACTFLGRYTGNRAAIVAISATAFGLAHWSLGAHAVLVTGAIGAVFMVLYLATRSVYALALAHFAVNYIDFAGVVPKSVFRVF